MTAVTLGNMFAYPMHPYGWPRPAGSLDYRVTNRYDGPDFLNGGIHRATDTGNGSTGYTLRAPAACRARGLLHSDSAIGVEFDLGSGVVIQLWHLKSTSLARDRWTQVAKGQAVGITGNSGARLPDGSVMPHHTHIAALRNGVPFDIEPYLPMVERPAAALQLEDDVSALEAKTTYLREPFVAVLKPGTAIREDTNTQGGMVDRSPNPGDAWSVVVIGTADGEVVNGSPEWLVYGGHKRSLLTVHASTVAARKPIGVAADCSAQDRTIAQLRTQISRASTSAAGAAQAAQATVEALRP